MTPEANSTLRIGELRHGQGPHRIWVVYPQGPVRYGVGEVVPQADPSHGRQSRLWHARTYGTDHLGAIADATSLPRRSLCQESFFVCTVRNIGDLPGARSIYVEAVVDCDSGTAFAKVYPARNAINAVDILVSRVVPFFQNHQTMIERISTRKREEYCGLPPVHPYETFLITAQIQHLQLDHFGHVCENFFQILLRDFFPAVLREKFDLSPAEIQKELDAFVDTYKSAQMTRDRGTGIAAASVGAAKRP